MNAALQGDKITRLDKIDRFLLVDTERGLYLR